MKHLLILLSFCIVFHAACAQSTSQEIGSIDVLKNSATTRIRCLEKGEYYIHVTDMNPLIYKRKDSINLVQPPQDEVLANILQPLHAALIKTTEESPEVPDSKSLAFSNARQIAKKIPSLGEAKIEAFKIAYDQYRISVQVFQNALTQISTLSTFCNDVITICLDPKSNQSAIQQVLLTDPVVTAYIAGTTGMNSVVPSRLSMNRKVQAVLTDLKKAYDDCISKHGHVKKLYLELRIVNIQIRTDLIEVMEASDATITQVKSTYEKVNQNALTKLASGAGLSYSEILRQGSFEDYVWVNINDGNTADVVIDITSNDTSLAQNQRHTFSVRIRGGFRTFTAPGLMLNFLGAREEKYYLDADGIVRQGEQDNAAFPSLSVMQLFYWRKCKDNFWAGAVGLSANFTDLTSVSDLRIFAGPAYVIGDQTKLVFTAGITGGYVDSLKGYFKENEAADAGMLEQEDNELTDDFFRFGIYAGLAIKIPSK